MRRALLIAIALCSTAFAQQTYTSGTVFTENFGNNATNPQLCPDATTTSCVQTWLLAQGSAPAIVAAPAGWTGSALKFAKAATAPIIQQVGTFPIVAAGKPWVVTLTVEEDASSGSFIALFNWNNTAGGGNEFFINSQNGGFESGNGTTCGSGGQGTVHTLVGSSNGTVITFKIDGVQCGATFADPGVPPNQLNLDGDGSNTYNTFIQQLTITGVTGVTGGWPPSVFMDWAGQAGNTVNAANLQAGTHCGNAINGSSLNAWTQEATSGVSFSFVNDGQLFAANLPVCGTNYPGTNNATFAMAVTTAANSGGDWTETFNTVSTTGVSLGEYFKFNTTGTFFSGSPIGLDFIELGAGTDTYNLQIQSNVAGTQWFICLENDNGGGTAPCTATSFSQNTWYWVSFNLANSTVGHNNAWFYSVNANGSVNTLLETLTAVGTFEPWPSGLVSFAVKLGKTGSETMPSSANVFYSNVIVDYFNAAFPLLPPAGASAFGFSQVHKAELLDQ